MAPRHQVSRSALDLVKRFEGYRRTAARLSDGGWTIGYGHTLTAREGAEVGEADAEALLLYDLMAVAHQVSDLLFADVSQNQFDALCAFAFSIGLEAFRGSDVLKRVNEGAFAQAAFSMELWRRAAFEGERIVVDALIRRRAAEKLLFLTPAQGAWPPAPSAVLKPEFDSEALDLAPRERPAELVASLHGEAAAVSRVEEPAPVVEPAAENPVLAAAEALSQRLQTLFPEPAPAEPEAASEAVEAAPASASADSSPGYPGFACLPDLEAESPPEAEPVAETTPAAAGPAVEPLPHILIDDTAPFEFTPPVVAPLPQEEGDGFLAMLLLALLGLAFLSGGVFWALNAEPAREPGLFTPVLVGWLAGVAGVGFVAAAVFLALQRLAASAERREFRRSR
jgi:lysozyme